MTYTIKFYQCHYTMQLRLPNGSKKPKNKVKDNTFDSKKGKISKACH